ncbi:MAG: phosphatase PAP2 family protein [Candidatus Hadarchaeum sp.]
MNGLLEQLLSISLNLLPFDWIIIFYLTITGVLIILFHKNLTRWHTYLLLWAILTLSILSFSFLPNPLPFPFQVLRDWYPIATILAFYWRMEPLTQLIFQDYFDDRIIQWEAELFKGQPSIYLSKYFPCLLFSEFLHFCYLSFYGIVIFLITVLYLQGRREIFYEVVFAEVFTFTLCFIWHIFMPVVGPRYKFEKIKGHLADGFIHKLTHFVLSRGSSKGTAFPSSHAAVTVIVLLNALRYDLISFTLLFPLCSGLILGTVYGRFHYAIDTILGIVLACTIFLITPVVYQLLL